MNASEPHWLTIVFGVIGFFVAIWIGIIVAKFIVKVRDELRDHYTNDRWTPIAWDVAGVPVWLLLELLCILGLLVVGAFTLFLAYQTAKDARDWWHEGHK